MSSQAKRGSYSFALGCRAQFTAAIDRRLLFRGLTRAEIVLGRSLDFRSVNLCRGSHLLLSNVISSGRRHFKSQSIRALEENLDHKIRVHKNNEEEIERAFDREDEDIEDGDQDANGGRRMGNDELGMDFERLQVSFDREDIASSFLNNNVILREDLEEKSSSLFRDDFLSDILRGSEPKIKSDSYNIDYRILEGLKQIIRTTTVTSAGFASSSLDRWKLTLQASDGQSMNYLDAVIEQLAAELNADILRLENIELEEIFWRDVRLSLELNPHEWLSDDETDSHLFRRSITDRRSDVLGESEGGGNTNDLTGTGLSGHGGIEENKIQQQQERMSSCADAKISPRDYEMSLIESMLSLVSKKRQSYNQGEVRPLIIHIKDYESLADSNTGYEFMRRLDTYIRHMRSLGSPIVLIGTYRAWTGYGKVSEDELSAQLKIPQLISTIEKESAFTMENCQIYNIKIPKSKLTFNPFASEEITAWIRQTNLRYLSLYIKRQFPAVNDNIFDFPEEWLKLESDSNLFLKAISYRILMPQKIVEIIECIKPELSTSSKVRLSLQHLSEKMAVVNDLMDVKNYWTAVPKLLGISQIESTDLITYDEDVDKIFQKTRDEGEFEIASSQSSSPHNFDIDILRSNLNESPEDIVRRKQQSQTYLKSLSSREKNLLYRMIEPSAINVEFSSVIASPETIEAMNDTVALALEMPDEFDYGVLADNGNSGVLLYGPPGTGKTMLVKALAKAGNTRVLAIQPGDILDKYVGEAEKNVKALFSLAKKLYPCVIFIDEVDALLIDRSRASKNKTHEMINQFMSEWDGVQSRKILVIGATNRPFDLDDAILRRFSRRILVDLPSTIDREKILRVHLANESVDDAVNLHKLANQLPSFSGSDIKNLCVAAALTAVKERQKLNKSMRTSRRVLTQSHFDSALNKIRASVTDQMDTVQRIREWDHEFGQNRSLDRLKSWGFGSNREKKHVVR
ncbi:hypothetical protein V1511DRAFT_496714 [Dipodascopsis uninucleata]